MRSLLVLSLSLAFDISSKQAAPGELLRANKSRGKRENVRGVRKGSKEKDEGVGGEKNKDMQHSMHSKRLCSSRRGKGG